jgi:8-oxo-dGTP diphosphatase
MIVIVAAIIRRDDQVLLVRQQGPNDPTAVWALPGGVVEPGELLTEALAREVREETGLTIRDIGHLAYVAETDVGDHHLIVFMFEARNWAGEITTGDPDGYVLEARWAPAADAIDKLSALPYRSMHEPIVAYLRGEVGTGVMWFYRRQADGKDTLIARMTNSKRDE